MAMKKIILFLVLFTANNVFSQSLFDYVKSNNYKAVKAYTDSINSRDDDQATPLMWAVYSSDLKMVKMLISKGADPNLKGWINFRDSSLNGYFAYGSCLVIAAGENKLDILKYLLVNQKIPIEDKEINLDENTENGWTALQWASVQGNLDIINYLVKNGANINSIAETENNATPLIFALMFNHKEAAKLLIDLGADINKKDSKHLSPLDHAIYLNDNDLINLMIEKGAKSGGQ